MPDSDSLKPGSDCIKIETNVAVIMRDGVTLYADVYRPDSAGPFPVILQRTPYDKTTPLTMVMLDPIKAAKRGYAMVIQDTRGRFTSEGEFYCFRDDINDGYDTVEWAASQPWSTGKVGMCGTSYVGATQWLSAISQPPHLAAIAPNVTASNYHDGWTYQGGAFELGFNVSWTMLQLTLANFKNIASGKSVPPDSREKLVKAIDAMQDSFLETPVGEFPHLKGGLADYFYDWTAHPDYDDYWKKLCIEDHHSRVTAPALNIGGWYDIFLGGTLRNYMGMGKNGGSEEARKGQKLIIGPWQHGARGTSLVGTHYFGLAADATALDLDGIHFRWYDHWLKGENNGFLDEPPVRRFVMGDNVWRDEQEWPLVRAQATNYYLRSQGKANSLKGNGSLSTETPSEEPPDVFLYNPEDPVPTMGGALCCNPYFAANGAYEQSAMVHQHLGCRMHSVQGGNGPVCPDLNDQPLIVCYLSNPGVLHGVVDLSDRAVDRVYGQRANGVPHRRLCRDVPLASLNVELYVQCAFSGVQCCNVQLRVDDLKVCRGNDIAGIDLTGPSGL